MHDFQTHCTSIALVKRQRNGNVSEIECISWLSLTWSIPGGLDRGEMWKSWLMGLRSMLSCGESMKSIRTSHLIFIFMYCQVPNKFFKKSSCFHFTYIVKSLLNCEKDTNKLLGNLVPRVFGLLTPLSASDTSGKAQLLCENCGARWRTKIYLRPLCLFP